MYVHCFQNPTSTKETSFGAYSDAPIPNHNRNAPTVSFYKNKEHVSFTQFIYYCINSIKQRLSSQSIRHREILKKLNYVSTESFEDTLLANVNPKKVWFKAQYIY